VTNADILSTVEVSMAAVSEVFITHRSVTITALLQRIETSFQSRNWITKLAACTRSRPIAGDIIVCQISNMDI